MHAARLKWTDFMVWLPKGQVVVRVEYDAEFFNKIYRPRTRA